jgi:hypothetical protein
MLVAVHLGASQSLRYADVRRGVGHWHRRQGAQTTSIAMAVTVPASWSASRKDVKPFKGSAESHKRLNKLHPFHNKRAEAYFKLAEALSPDQPGGSVVQLPNDAALKADLCSVRFKITPRGTVLLESKDEIRKRIGRSPDRADAVVLAWYAGSDPRSAWRSTMRKAAIFIISSLALLSPLEAMAASWTARKTVTPSRTVIERRTQSSSQLARQRQSWLETGRRIELQRKELATARQTNQIGAAMQNAKGGFRQANRAAACAQYLSLPGGLRQGVPNPC